MSSTAAPVPWVRRFLAAYLQPLVFVVGFPLAFTSALHAPEPHELPLVVAGPASVTASAVADLDATDELDVTSEESPEAARDAVAERDALGAVWIEVDAAASTADQVSATVTTYVAGGAGLAASQAVESVGEQLASGFGTESEVVDLAPLTEGDGVGTALFFLLTYASLGGYLAIISLMQFLPTARLRTRYVAAGVTAVGSPLLVYGLSSIFVGTYGVGLATTLALLAVCAVYVFTVSALAILLQQFLGKAATAGVMVLVVFLNFPGSGGSLPAELLPAFWRAVHGVYFGAGALESFRSIVYFDGHGLSRWLPQLLAWTVVIVLATLLVHRHRLRAAGASDDTTAGLDAGSPSLQHAGARHASATAPADGSSEGEPRPPDPSAGVDHDRAPGRTP